MTSAICTIAGIAILLASMEVRYRVGINWYGIAMLIAGSTLVIAGMLL